MRFRGANPVYRNAQYDRAYSDLDAASYSGVAAKTAILLGIITVIALYMSARLDFAASSTLIITGMIIAPIIAFIMVIVTHRRPEIAPFTTTIYAVMEGMFLGLISTIVAAYAGGQVVQMALLGTFGVLAGMLFLYTTGIIRVGHFFRRLMFSMLIGLVVTSLLMVVLVLLGQTWIYDNTLYLGFSLLSVVISSLYLLIDFDNINKYVEGGVDKRSEWSLALGLVVTIVWLYVELLRLILILTSRD